MRLSQLLPSGEAVRIGEDVTVTGIQYDSRRVEPGDLFVAVPGFKSDGHDFISAAVQRGAVAVMVERQEAEGSIPQLLVADCRTAMARAAHRFFAEPSRKLRVVAVTGTNGKTTTTFLIKQGLEAVGFRVALMGTIHNMIGDAIFPAGRTTPEAIDIQRFLADAVADGCHYVVLEASSHGLALGRLDDLEVDVAVFTNLSQDHLDFHPDFEAYFQAKAKLFHILNQPGTKDNKAAVINGDDPYGRRLLDLRLPRVLTFGINGGDVQAVAAQVHPAGVAYTLASRGTTLGVDLPLAGTFNIYNSLGAAAVFLNEGLSARALKQAMGALRPVPGRFELVQAGQRFPVVVDYAHTPDGLTNVLQTARSVSAGRVIAVFGAGGDRDAKKRPLMAAAAAALADYIIITSDNPRSEDPLTICQNVEEGLLESGFANYHVEPERRAAITQAVAMAKETDIVVIAGKGHETYQESHGQRIHFDDREVALAALKELR